MQIPSWLFWAPALVLFVCAFVGGYVVGRRPSSPAASMCPTAPAVSTPAPVREDVHVDTKRAEVVKEKKVKTQHRIPQADGSTVITTETDTDRHTDTDVTVDRVPAPVPPPVRVVDVPLADARPWRLTGMGGVSLAPAPEVVWGGALERKLAGPLRGGVWGLKGKSYSAVGLELSVEF